MSLQERTRIPAEDSAGSTFDVDGNGSLMAEQKRSLGYRLVRAVAPFLVVTFSFVSGLLIWGVPRFDSIGDALL